MKSLLIAVLMALPISRATAICTPQTTGGGVTLLMPNLSDPGYIWGPCLVYDMGVLISSTGVLAQSTWSVSGMTLQNETQYGVCLTTVSITTGGHRVQTWFNGAVYAPIPTAKMGFNVLQDGAFVPPYSANEGIISFGQGSSTYTAVSFDIILSSPTAGAHSYCFTTADSSGTINFEVILSTPQFGVREVQ